MIEKKNHKEANRTEGVIVAEFEGNYGRNGFVWLEQLTCMRCKELKLCLSMDGSDGEYYFGSMCRDCLNSAFDAVEAEIDEAGTPMNLIINQLFGKDSFREFQQTCVKCEKQIDFQDRSSWMYTGSYTAMHSRASDCG